MKSSGYAIFCEGPDNVGKSSLIKNIVNYFNKEVFIQLHYSNIKQSTKEKHIKYSKKLYKNMFKIINFQNSVLNNSVILDRSHIGEMVYSPLYRNYDGEYVLDLENIKTKKQYLITLIDEPENLINRDDGLSISINLEDKKKEIDLFKIAHDTSTIKNKLLININGYDEMTIANRVLNFIKGII